MKRLSSTGVTNFANRPEDWPFDFSDSDNNIAICLLGEEGAGGPRIHHEIMKGLDGYRGLPKFSSYDPKTLRHQPSSPWLHRNMRTELLLC